MPRLKALVANWFGWAQRAGLPGGCPVAAALFEFDDIEGAVRDKIVELERGWRRLLKQMVREAIECGHVRRDLDIDQFVWELSAIGLGHHAAHRFLRSPDADRRARTAFAALLERATPAADKKTSGPRSRKRARGFKSTAKEGRQRPIHHRTPPPEMN